LASIFPSNPSTGQEFTTPFNITYKWNGEAWIVVSPTKGIIRCTSTTRPGTPEEGELIYETDTEQVLVWNGSEWAEISGGGATVAFQEEQPDVTNLDPGTLWVDSDRPAVNGLMAQTFLRWIKTLSASASVFSGNDDNLNPLFYTPEFEQVYLNGTLLVRGDDYTATDGLIITLDEAASDGDVLEIHAFEPFNVTNQYTKNAADAKFATQQDLDNIDLTAYVEKSETELVKYGSDEPLEPEEGMIWIDSTNILKPITKVYNGSTWIIASGQAEAAIHPFFLAGI
jgi:hypothetical protein